jgi:hypothetical protein
MKDMKVIKIFIDHNNEGEIVCPKCEKNKTIHVSKDRIPLKPIRVKCNCGYSFSILLEYRKYHRKVVSIPGKLLHRETGDEIAEIVITSVSVVGLGFDLKSAASVTENEVYRVVFTLDDSFESTIQEEIIVTRINGRSIGAEFGDQDKYNYELDFYVMSQLSLP